MKTTTELKEIRTVQMDVSSAPMGNRYRDAEGYLTTDTQMDLEVGFPEEEGEDNHCCVRIENIPVQVLIRHDEKRKQFVPYDAQDRYAALFPYSFTEIPGTTPAPIQGFRRGFTQPPSLDQTLQNIIHDMMVTEEPEADNTWRQSIDFEVSRIHQEAYEWHRYAVTYKGKWGWVIEVTFTLQDENSLSVGVVSDSMPTLETVEVRELVLALIKQAYPEVPLEDLEY